MDRRFPPRGSRRLLGRLGVPEKHWTGDALEELWHRVDTVDGGAWVSPPLPWMDVRDIEEIMVHLRRDAGARRVEIRWGANPDPVARPASSGFRLSESSVGWIDVRIDAEQLLRAALLESPFRHLLITWMGPPEALDLGDVRIRPVAANTGRTRRTLHEGRLRDAIRLGSPAALRWSGDASGPEPTILRFGARTEGCAAPVRLTVAAGAGTPPMSEISVPKDEAWEEHHIELRSEDGTVELSVQGGGTGCVLWLGSPMLHPTGSTVRPRVILYVVDTLRADHLGFLGHNRPTSPALDRLAATSLVFERTVAAATWTRPSVVSLFSSLHPGTHRVGRSGGTDRLPEEVTTLADVFREAGYLTASFAANVSATSGANLDQGFDEAWTPLAFDVLNARTKADQVHSDDIHRHVLPWIEEHAELPFFLYVHAIDPHRPLAPPRPVRGIPGDGEKDLYDREIAFLDGRIAEMTHTLEQLGIDGETLFVLTSDHGESFHERGVRGHGNNVHREETWIPLLFRRPGSILPRRVAHPVGTVDIAPTILDLVDLETPTTFQGKSLREAEASTSRPAFAVRFNFFADGETEHFAVVDGDWKLVVVGTWDLARVPEVQPFDREQDPEERTNVAAENPGVVRRLLGSLHQWIREQEKIRTALDLDDSAADTALSEAERRELEALGYIDGGDWRGVPSAPPE